MKRVPRILAELSKFHESPRGSPRGSPKSVNKNPRGSPRGCQKSPRGFQKSLRWFSGFQKKNTREGFPVFLILFKTKTQNTKNKHTATNIQQRFFSNQHPTAISEWDLVFWVWRVGLGVWDLVIRAWDFGVWGLASGVWGLGLVA